MARLAALWAKINTRAYRTHGTYMLASLLQVAVIGLLSHSSLSARTPQYRMLSKVEAKLVTQEGAYDPTVLLVKFDKSSRSKINNNNAANTGSAGVSNTIRKYKAKKFERIAKASARSNTSAELFGWYKITLDPSLPIVAKEEGGITSYPVLEAMKEDLEKVPGVIAVEKNYIAQATVVPNDPYYSSSGSWGQGFEDLYGLKNIHAEQAWDQTTGSSSVVVAVIDSGVDRTHPDISGNIWTNSGETPSNGLDDDNNGYVDDYYGWNWCNGNNNTADDHGHGTHVAGTIAATGNNGSGVVGVSWGAKIMSLKYLCSNGFGSTSNAALALQYASDMHARISSNSYGCICAGDSFMNDAIKYEYDNNVVPVVAAGNNSANALDQGPAAADGAITVAASDNTNTIASYSNTGARIDVTAPGSNILSLKSANASAVCTGGSVVNTTYCQISGTSMATPHVSGLVALMMSMNNSLTTEQVRQILRTTATDLGTAGRDNTYGSGLINANLAVAASTTPTVLAPYISSLKTRSTIHGSVDIRGTVNGATLQSYKIEAGQGRTPSSWVTLMTSSTPITDNAIATVDTTALPDNVYTFRLTATATNTKTYEYSIYDVTVDNFYTDIKLPLNEVATSTVTPIEGTVSMAGGLIFDHYSIDYGVGASPSSFSMTGVTLANGGLAAVNNGAMGTWNTTGLTAGQTYTLRITIYATNASTSITTTPIVVNAKLKSGWPKRLSGANCSVICEGTGHVLTDLNGDGKQEIVTAGVSNTLYAYNKDGSNVTGFPVSIPSNEFFYNRFVAADIDGDLLPEIIINATVPPGNTKKLYIFKGDGTQYPGWTPKTVGVISSYSYSDPAPSVADIDGDGKQEIVYVEQDATLGARLHAYKSNNTEASGFPRTISSYVTPWIDMPPTIADLDSDGHPEIIYAGYNKMAVFDYQGAIRSGWPVTMPNYLGSIDTIQSPASVGDMNGDGQLDIVFYSQLNGQVGSPMRAQAYRANGSSLSGWPYSAVTATQAGLDTQNVALADIDNDGKDEAILGNGVSGVIDDGTGKRTMPYTSISQSDVSLADMSGTGSLELPGLYSFGMGWSYVANMSSFYTDGGLSSQGTAGNNEVAIPASDIDKNGSLEFITHLKSNGEFYSYLWEMTGYTTHPKDSWPMSGHDPAHTSRYTSGQKVSDTLAPQVVVTSPANGTTVSGTTALGANSIDDTAVTSVEFYVDGSLNTTDTTFPYSGSWNTSGLSVGSHTVYAKSYDAVAHITTSATITVNITDTSAPSVPSNLHLSSATSHDLNIAWDASTDDVEVTGYRVYRNGTSIGTTASTSLSDSGLAPSTSYAYQVEAYDAALNTSARVSQSFSTTSDVTAPSAPTSLNAANVNATSQRIQWAASTDDVVVTGYQIYRNNVLIGTSSALYFDDSGLTPSTSYTYKVRAYDAIPNYSVYSSDLVAATTPDATAPAVPTGLQLTLVTKTEMHLSWIAASDNVGVTGYRVYKGGSLLSTTSGLSYDVSSLSPNTTYSFTVRAYDANNNTSADSSSVSANTLPNTVTVTTAQKRGDVNGDNRTNILDLSLLLANWGKSTTTGDLDNNHVINIFDLSILLYEYGK